MATKNVTRKILIFVLPSDEAGKSFKDYAFEHVHTNLVQFTVANSKVDRKRVLVRGTGSFMFDTNMKEELVSYAHQLGGYLAKEIH